MSELILASTSPYRRELLARLAVPFRCVAPPIDEEAYKRSDLSPPALAEYLAEVKARSVAELEPTAIVIGCDQLATCAGRILGKPGSVAGANAQLAALAGKEHALITALVVLCGEQIERHTDIATLRMRSLTAAEIAGYVSLDAPHDCAGSYKLECHGITLFESIRSGDHSAITGLPLIALTTILRRYGKQIPPMA